MCVCTLKYVYGQLVRLYFLHGFSRTLRYLEQRLRVVPRLACLKRRQNVRFSISETRDRAAAVRLECRNGTMLKNKETTWGRVPVQKARSGGRALKQERVPRLGSSDVAVVRTRGC